MSSREPDNSQLRDTLLAKLMAESLASSSTASGSAAPGAGCPDTETVAAYAERNLSPAGTARLDVHFADCSRCQTVLAALARSLDSLPASGTAESAADSPRPALANVPRRSIALPAKSQVSARDAAQSSAPASKIFPVIKTLPPPQPTRWSELAPALGIAAAIALWFALRPAPPTQNLSAQLRTDTETAATQLQTAPAPALSDKDIANPDTTGANNSAAAAPSSAATPARPVPPPPSPQESQQLSGEALARDVSREDALKKSAPAEQTANAPATTLGGASAGIASRKELQASQSAPAPRTPSASAPNSGTGEASSAALDAPLAGEASKSAAPQVAGAGVGGAAPAASIAPTGERAKSAVAIDMLTSPVTAAVAGDLRIVSAKLATFASPNGAVIWRIGAGGSIERSADRGQTWEKQTSGVFGELTAGSAISNNVAWIVGRAGIILRTADGVHWQRVSLPPAFAASRNTIMTAASPAATSSATDLAAPAASGAKSANAVPSGAAQSGTVPPAAASAQSNRALLDLAGVTATDALHATVTSASGRRFTTSDGGQTWTSQ